MQIPASSTSSDIRTQAVWEPLKFGAPKTLKFPDNPPGDLGAYRHGVDYKDARMSLSVPNELLVLQQAGENPYNVFPLHWSYKQIIKSETYLKVRTV